MIRTTICSIVLVLFAFGCKPLKKRGPNSMIQWQKVYGRENWDNLCAIQQTKDGGYIVGATRDSLDDGEELNHGGKDYWLFKIDASGAIQWQKSYGGNADDILHSVQQTKDGGYIIAGESHSDFLNAFGAKVNHGGEDYWIIKTDSTGTIQWQKLYGGTNDDLATSIQQTRDGGYIITGGSNSNDGDVVGRNDSDQTVKYWIVKIDSTGLVQWQKSYGGTQSDLAICVQQTANGNYVIAGTSSSLDGDISGHHGSSNSPDYWVIEIDSVGAIRWQKSYGGIKYDMPTSMIQTSDGGLILIGESRSSDGDVTGHHGTDSTDDYWVVKIDSMGGIQWQKSYGGSDNDDPFSIIQTSGGGYIIAGASNSTDGDVTDNHGKFDYWIVKIDNAGGLQWQQSFGGNGLDVAHSIQQTTDGGYIVGGVTTSESGDVLNYTSGVKYWIVKLKNSPDKE
ncbi:MAG TPA: T9SS C-terminal target domain-containing protein [Candidatus Kapabacteria bacterium]|nr:T9SS C-terminal target domain-containing protein [Candidatus Kapabacteria bacterium]